MEKIKKTIKQLLATRIVSLALVGALLVCAVYLVMQKTTYSWFSLNRTTTATGSSLGVDAKSITSSISVGTWDKTGWTYDAYLPISDPELDLVSLNVPGEVARFKIRFSNLAHDGSVSVSSFGLRAFTAEEETGITVNDVDYYLGTQLRVRCVTTDGEWMPLAAYASGSSGSLATPGDLILYAGPEQIAGGASIEIEIEVEFVNADVPQNVYAEFGEGGEVCARRLFFSFN